MARFGWIAAAVAMLCMGSTEVADAKSVVEYERDFVAWMRAHHLTFSDALEYARRFETYIKNDMFIMAHNALDHLHGFKLGHNEFSHLTFEEFSHRVKGIQMPKEYLQARMSAAKRNGTFVQSVNVPESVDWVEKGGVTPVKNQGQCGSCWAFSTTGAVEGAVFAKSGKLPNLSEQQLVDCDHNGDMGCNGGLMDHAFAWIEENGGICSEEEYEYHAKASVCRTCKHVVKVSGYHDVEPNNEQALKAAVAQQPVAVAIEADQPEFQFYKSGVFNKKCGTQLDHGVLAVGYGIENGVKYWKIKNSWGPSWGENGYIRFAREADTPAGKCGIAMVPSYPVASWIEEDKEVKTEAPAQVSSSNLEKKELKSTGSSAKISQCGNKEKSIVSFDDLEITPKSPKRGKPISFFGNGQVKADFDSAEFKLKVKLGGAQVFSHSGAMCGDTHVPLPLGLGHIDVHGFKCPMKTGKFHDLKVDVNLPIIAPSGNYEIQLLGGNTDDGSDDALFCIHVELQLDDDQDFKKSRVYEFLPEA